MDFRSFFGKCPTATKTETKTKTKTSPRIKREDLVERIAQVLESGTKMTAKEIATALNSTRHVVNRGLYGTPTRFVWKGKKKTAPLWTLGTRAVWEDDGDDEEGHTEQCECGAYLGGRKDWTEGEFDEHPDREPGYDLDGQWWCPEHREGEE
jgi:hypothetical protein